MALNRPANRNRITSIFMLLVAIAMISQFISMIVGAIEQRDMRKKDEARDARLRALGVLPRVSMFGGNNDEGWRSSQAAAGFEGAKSLGANTLFSNVGTNELLDLISALEKNTELSKESLAILEEAVPFALSVSGRLLDFWKTHVYSMALEAYSQRIASPRHN